MPTITTKDGTEIFYKDWGSGQPIVFSHGWPLSFIMSGDFRTGETTAALADFLVERRGFEPLTSGCWHPTRARLRRRRFQGLIVSRARLWIRPWTLMRKADALNIKRCRRPKRSNPRSIPVR